MRTQSTRRAVLGAAAAALATPALAQPVAGGRTIRIVVPFGAGGAVDIVARLVAQEIAPRLGQTVVVENRTGGGGNIAMEHVARATPDGTTLLMASPSVIVNPHLYPSLTYDQATQLAPLMLVGEVPSVMIAPPSFEASDARSFIAMARARPGHFTYGSGGSGTTEHLASELLKLRAGLDLVHVPYRGGAPAMTDLQAGRLSVMFTNLAQALPLIRGGQFKVLGVADRQRHPALPDAPTFAEQGIEGINVTVWWGIMAPAGLPAETTQRLHAVLAESIAAPSMVAALERLSAKPLGGSIDSFAQRLASEGRSWGEVIRSANIRAE
ncbi:tripartite tricarboxylate transporter substrate binding protein [Roseomonas stagni]|uniref:Tripartite tricarboxylate transporter substrate binding protein n=1 Tax=Falsiroseomonas algicola TaxID=2716930 RepID=A0A6M1LK78_9PROT|nr:tripartite tricarboxylate transporter substrate binding protein [Falsiroseomonas algicola]NGM20745.1 tripartite tricarboxylate transporter substrate binding protein [Falsiroseomonas algicola]